jgi:hypothetical protein
MESVPFPSAIIAVDRVKIETAKEYYVAESLHARYTWGVMLLLLLAMEKFPNVYAFPW